MHSISLSTDLIPDCARVCSAAFFEDELFQWLRRHLDKYPYALKDAFVLGLHQRLNQPGMAAKVCVSDDNDSWWDEAVGSEVLGVAL
jgi:hypothetical protein